MPIALPADLTTELSAVNVLLAVIGEQPVQGLDAVESADAEAARNTLQEKSRMVQARGWHWNREYTYPLSPNQDKEVLLPANCGRVVRAYWDAYGDTPCRVSERGRKLYNSEKRTYEWESDVYVDMILQLEWEEMPEYARQAILYHAAKQFQVRELTSSTVGRATDEDLAIAMATLEQAEDEAEPANAITGNKYIQSALSRNLRRRT